MNLWKNSHKTFVQHRLKSLNVLNSIVVQGNRESQSPLAEFCNFDDTLDVMIRNRLVCGINDTEIQKRLLSQPELTYVKAVEIAQAAETAAQSLR